MMDTAKSIGQEVAEEVRGFLTQAGISEINFLRGYHFDHRLLARLRAGESVTTATIEKLYRAIIEENPDWEFRHERRQAVLTRARAFRSMRDGSADLQISVTALDQWPRRQA